MKNTITFSKYTTIVLMGIVLCFGILFADTAHAQSRFGNSSERTIALQERIQALLEQVANLRTQIKSPRSNNDDASADYRKPAGEVIRPAVCSSPWARSLGRGSRGEDVTKLQEFLKEKGHFSEEATGYFGPVTERAVQAFQRSQGVVSSGNPWSTGYGHFGVKTRAAIDKLCDKPDKEGCGPTEFCKPHDEDEDECGPTEFCKQDEEETAFKADVNKRTLKVTFTSYVTGQGGGAKIYFGDGRSAQAKDCYAPADRCLKPGENTHVYKKAGTYTATLRQNRTNKLLGSVKVVIPETGKVVDTCGRVFCPEDDEKEEEKDSDECVPTHCDVFPEEEEEKDSDECDPTHCDVFPEEEEDEEVEDKEECGPTEFCEPSDSEKVEEESEEVKEECGPTEFCKQTDSDTRRYSQSSYWYGAVQGASTTQLIEELKTIVQELQTVAQLYSALE